MNYLVTGGAGFIGSHLVRSLIERGAHVRVLDNFSTGRRDNLAGLDIELIEGDLRDPVCISRAVRDMEVIFHEAAFVSVPESMEKPGDCLGVNVSGTSLLLDAARQAGVVRVVIASSAAVYGESENFPLVEDAPIRQLSPYAVSKRINEMFAELFSGHLGLEVTALRYFNVYGPRQRPDSMYAAAVPIFVRRLLDHQPVVVHGDGLQTRDLINVHDVVQANLIASAHPAAPGETFNVCTGVETRLLDLVDILSRIIPDAPSRIHANPRAGDIRRSVGSPKKAKDLLGFNAEVTLEEGLAEAVSAMGGTKSP